MEYGCSAWATTSKTNTSRLDKVQNAWIRPVTDGMKTTPNHNIDVLTRLRSLVQSLCMPTEMQNPTQSWLKGTSFNHLSKSILRKNEDLLSIFQPKWWGARWTLERHPNHHRSSLHWKEWLPHLSKICYWRWLMTSISPVGELIYPQTDLQKDQWRMDKQASSSNTQM